MNHIVNLDINLEFDSEGSLWSGTTSETDKKFKTKAIRLSAGKSESLDLLLLQLNEKSVFELEDSSFCGPERPLLFKLVKSNNSSRGENCNLKCLI